MKLEVGMYVRFDYKKQQQPIMVAKIIKVEYAVQEDYYYYLTDLDFVISDDNIIKSSNNIIDLIEAGDYVNGYKVDFVQNNEVIYNGNHPSELLIRAKDIRSIVTKEQFKSNEYVVE